jgi:hypothetical protein
MGGFTWGIVWKLEMIGWNNRFLFGGFVGFLRGKVGGPGLIQQLVNQILGFLTKNSTNML